MSLLVFLPLAIFCAFLLLGISQFHALYCEKIVTEALHAKRIPRS